MLILPYRIAVSMRTLLACASLTLALAACGYKGPLVLPKAPPSRPASHPAAPAPHVDASAAKGEASAAR
ncbi:LPS translocon maturation chaperone LptM [Chromobacterium sphagni]|uniref:LPS translocon maturation chaperone LptM n=2 Tax=Chromobacterium sphagni TaxID=1903179 RepID=UPI000C768FDF